MEGLKKRKDVALVLVLLALIFLGVFFAVTDPTSWPTRKIMLTATDMSLIPPVSTLWCESVVLHSSHEFVAYKVNSVPSVTTKLSRNEISAETKLDRKSQQHLEIKYFMLPGSVLNVFACASNSYAYIRIYRGTVDKSCRCALAKHQQSSELDSDEDSDDSEYDDMSMAIRGLSMDRETELCPRPLRTDRLTVAYAEECRHVKPISINVTKSDYFTVYITNNNYHSNKVKVSLSLDRTLYNITKSQQNVYYCGGTSTSCSLPLAFASKDRVVVSMPSETNAGKNSYMIESRCYPRIILFAVLTFGMPFFFCSIMLYIFIRSAALSRNIKNTVSGSDHEARALSSPLVGQSCPSDDVHGPVCTSSHDEDLTLLTVRFSGNEPPSYEHLFGSSPPPYSSLMAKQNK